jgi:hypothetical protein
MRLLFSQLVARVGILVAAMSLVATLAVGRVAEAQEASPTPVGEIVPPEECTTPARSITFLSELIATPISATPVATFTTLPKGRPADDQTVAAVTAVVRQLAACSNTGNVLRPLSLYGDEYLRRALNAGGGMTAEEADALLAPFATPIALQPEMMVRLVEIKNVVVLEDGRVAALTVTDGGLPDAPGLTTDLLIFAKRDTGWYIEDAVSNFDQVLAGATPAT